MDLENQATTSTYQAPECDICGRRLEAGDQAACIKAPTGGYFIVCDPCMEKQFNEHLNIGTRQ